MAFMNKLSPIARSVADQVRGAALGVNAGGTSGRSSTVYKGVGLDPAKGGANVRGSGAAPMKAPRRVIGGPPMKGPHPARPKPPMGLRPKPKPVAARPKPKPKPKPSVGAPAPAPVAAPTPRLTGPLDYSGLSSFTLGSAGIAADYGAQRAQIASQLSDNALRYGSSMREAKEGYVENVESGEDSAAQSGLLRSGARERADASRVEEFDRAFKDIEDQFGAGASQRLNAALAELAQQEALERQRLEAESRAEWDSVYGAAPLYEDPVVPAAPAKGGAGSPQRPSRPAGAGRSPVSAVPAGTPAPVAWNADPYRRVMRGGKSVLVRVSRMTPAERARL